MLPADEIPSDEAPTRRLEGFAGRIATTLAIGLSLYALYWVLFIVQPQVYRVSFLLVALVLSFLSFPRLRGSKSDVSALDWTLIAASIVALSWPLIDFSNFIYRAADPKPIDIVLGAVTVALVLEATRRAVGWILPVTAILFPALRVGRADASTRSACHSSRTAATTPIGWSARST